MTPEQFVYWMQGFAELNDGTPTSDQWNAVKDHLATVFDKVTPEAPRRSEIRPVPQTRPLRDRLLC